MARIQLMSDHAVNIRLDNVPPIVKPEHIAEYLSSLGSVELIEQVHNPRANYTTESYVIVIVPYMTPTVSFKSRRILTVNSTSKGKLIESSTHAKTWKASAVHAPHLVMCHPNVPKGDVFHM